jgi:endonuclease YncB( thermonuclease family)
MLVRSVVGAMALVLLTGPTLAEEPSAVPLSLYAIGKPPELLGKATALDGDDLMLTTAHGDQRIRLWGMDAFEGKQTCRNASGAWPCGRDAQAQLERLVAGKSVVCQDSPRRFWSWGRLKRKCEVDGQDLGEQLVLAGLAVARAAEYRNAEAIARMEGRGVWSGCFSDPSWFRKHWSGEMGDGCGK